MKKIKIVSAMLMVMVTIFANVIVAYAAPQTMPDGNVFDAEYYAAHNPDVVAVLGTDANALYNHYKTCGIKEGRLPYDGAATQSVKRSNISERLAQARYDAFYSADVYGRYGYTYDPSVFFDADYYLANYPELATTVGTDYKALFNHYINCGRFEGRNARMGIYPERGGIDHRVYYPDSGKVVNELPNDSWLNSHNCDLRMIEFLDTVTDDSMSDREVVTVIHDEICKRMTYNYGDWSDTKTPMTDMDAFLDGRCTGICQIYANTFSYMCNKAGIEAHVVSCESINHAYNRVKIDGIWYDIDVTWDDCLSNIDYFLAPAGTGKFAERTVDWIDSWFRMDMYPNLSFEEAVEYINMLNAAIYGK